MKKISKSNPKINKKAISEVMTGELIQYKIQWKKAAEYNL